MKKKQKKQKKQKHSHERLIKVHCKTCISFIPEYEIEIVNIEEDIQGADVLTFICPHCKKEQTSRRFG